MSRRDEGLVVVSDIEPRQARNREVRRAHGAGVASCAAGLVATAVVLAGCGPQPSPSIETPAAQADALAQIVQLAAQRAEVSDRVAAAKLDTGQPVTDPQREATVVAAARDAAARAGVDPEWVARVFTDQIAASTQVQTDLLREWADNPASQPAGRPDLAQIRLELDRIGEELVVALGAAAPVRAHEDCSHTLAQVATTQAGDLDALHRAALDRALTSVCDGSRS